eukprot:TRINITY_DN28986_c0_g2_i1.p1 TRINITY_DN28986_c0_g2~~TRINITY_DN28986_c0_g2_i1.p1  ORF type:complete len:593 (-),score=132.30 TRINITY_DN28986_c0_g2_i1:83-1612(-)
MVAGVPVKYFNVTTHAFESRTVICDDRFIFLQVQSDTAATLVVRLHTCVSVMEREEAMHLCKHWNIEDPGLNMNSAVVLQVAPVGKFEDFPSMDKLMVFMCAKQLKLKACLDAVRQRSVRFDILSLESGPAMSPRQDLASGIGLSSRSEISGTNQPKASPRGTRRRVARFRAAAEHGALLTSPNLKRIEMEVEFKPQSETLTVHDTIKIGVHARMLPSEVDMELTRMSRTQGIDFAAVDAARMKLILEELAVLRQWALQFATQDAFGLGIEKYLNTEALASATILQDEAFLGTARRISASMADLEQSSLQHDPKASYSLKIAEISTRCACKALMRLLDIEKEFAKMVQQASVSGAIDGAPSVYTLACQKLSAETDQVSRNNRRAMTNASARRGQRATIEASDSESSEPPLAAASPLASPRQEPLESPPTALPAAARGSLESATERLPEPPRAAATAPPAADADAGLLSCVSARRRGGRESGAVANVFDGFDCASARTRPQPQQEQSTMV